MKFLCDRCKTRYSIADERVRGKILKIRCKNCSAVISVREGMDESTEWAAPPAVDAAGAPAAAAAAPTPAPAAVRPPPSSLQEEWYVSLDGNQEGPFSLPDAQAWIGSKGPDDELHCWSEGFDDWLPVEKVSHFRGLRGKVTRARPPTRPVPLVDPAAAAAPEPKPLFAATLAAVVADAEAAQAATAAASGKPDVAAKPDPEPRPIANPSPTPAAPAMPSASSMPASASASMSAVPSARSSPSQTGPAASVSQSFSALAPLAPGSPTPPQGVPQSAPPAAGIPRSPSPLPAAAPPLPAARATLPKPSGATPGVGLPRLGGTPARPGSTSSSPALASTSTSSPPALASTATPATAPMLAPSSVVATPAPTAMGTPAPGSGPSRVAPSFDTGTDDEAPGTDDLLDDDAPPSHDPVDDIDDDLSIGEVSRVVRLADIMRQPPPARRAAPVRNATASAAAIARGTGAVSSMEISPAAGTADAVEAGAAAAGAAEAGQSIYASIVAPPRKRTAMYIAIAAGALALVAIVAVVATSGGGEDDEGATASTRKYDDLGFSVDDPLNPRRGTGPATAPDKGTGPATGGGTGRRPNTGSRTPTGSNPATGNGAATDKVGSPTIGPDGLPIKPLTPDDVFAMSNKMEIGTRRCYERAMKDDPFLKVTKIKATINVARSGVVSNVSLSAMQGTPLATCLAAAIGRWRFRASTEGIVSEFSIVFEQR